MFRIHILEQRLIRCLGSSFHYRRTVRTTLSWRTFSRTDSAGLRSSVSYLRLRGVRDGALAARRFSYILYVHLIASATSYRGFLPLRNYLGLVQRRNDLLGFRSPIITLQISAVYWPLYRHLSAGRVVEVQIFALHLSVYIFFCFNCYHV